MSVTSISASLTDIASARTAELVSERASVVTAWVVRLGEDLYVRTAPGASSPVVSRGLAGGRGHLRVDGVDRPVVLAEVAPELHGLLDDAYRAKYGQCSPERLADVVSDEAAATTLRLRPRRATWTEAATLWLAGRRARPASAAEPCTAC